MTYVFSEMLAVSKGQRKHTDTATIQSMLDGCTEVRAATLSLDIRGVDYIARLRGGSDVYIDAKTRQRGCSKYWGAEPDLAIELWSVKPTATCQGKPGWTLDEAKLTDLILYTWDPADTVETYLLPFQLLRVAARRNIRRWMEEYKRDIQDSGQWQSEAVFVPASEVISAIQKCMRSQAAPPLYPAETIDNK